MVHFGNKSVAEVVAERRNVVQEKYTASGASSRRFVPKIGEMAFFLWAVQRRCMFLVPLHRFISLATGYVRAGFTVIVHRPGR